MNLKEEILNVTETGVSPSTGVTFPWVRPWDAEDIAKEYAKEKVKEAYKAGVEQERAEHYLGWIMTDELINDKALEWWEENK